jgi:hypothetical protein
MDGNKEVGVEIRSNREIPVKETVDIQKIMEQCNIHPERWKEYISTEKN